MDTSQSAAWQSNTRRDHLSPQSIARPRDDHHSVSGAVSTAKADTWSAVELDASDEPLPPRYQGDRDHHLSTKQKIGLPSAGVELDAGS